MINLEIQSAKAVMAAFGNETVSFDIGDGTTAVRSIKAIVDRKGPTQRFGQKALAAVLVIGLRRCRKRGTGKANSIIP